MSKTTLLFVTKSTEVPKALLTSPGPSHSPSLASRHQCSIAPRAWGYVFVNCRRALRLMTLMLCIISTPKLGVKFLFLKTSPTSPPAHRGRSFHAGSSPNPSALHTALITARSRASAASRPMRFGSTWRSPAQMTMVKSPSI